jgi:hypothetical protein
LLFLLLLLVAAYSLSCSSALFLLLVPISCSFFLSMEVFFLNLILKSVLTHTLFVTIHQKIVNYILPRTRDNAPSAAQKKSPLPCSIASHLKTGPCEEATGKIDAMS